MILPAGSSSQYAGTLETPASAATARRRCVGIATIAAEVASKAKPAGNPGAGLLRGTAASRARRRRQQVPMVGCDSLLTAVAQGPMDELTRNFFFVWVRT